MNLNLFIPGCSVLTRQPFGKLLNRRLLSLALLAAVTLHPGSGLGTIYPNVASADWTAVFFAGQPSTDPARDHQTTLAEGDIVGNAANPSFYASYSDVGGGWLGFRFRLGADKHSNGLDGAAFVGMDANRDGAVDVFAGVNQQGSQSRIGLWKAGTGNAQSPAGTKIGPAAKTYEPASWSYRFAPVSPLANCLGDDLDLNQDGAVDQFLSFWVPLPDVAAVLEELQIPFDPNTSFQLMAATATQGNSLNQDLNGVEGGAGSKKSWAELGAWSDPLSAAHLAPVPEPSTLSLLALGGLVLLARRSRANRPG